MTLRHRLDDGMSRTFVSNQADRGLNELKVRLALVQTAYAIVLEGTTRASVSQIVDRATADYKVDVTAPVAGQILSSFSVESRLTHGKSKLVLDVDQLDKIRADVASQVEAAMAKLTAAIEKFQELPQRIDQLRQKWQEIQGMRTREQELVKLLNDDAENTNRIEYLETEYQKLQQRHKQLEELEDEIKALELKEKDLPDLQARQRAIFARFAEHERKSALLLQQERQIIAQEQQATSKEVEMAERLAKLQKRLGWLELAELEQAIEAAKNELNGISKQLKEKHSLLDIFKRNKGVNS